MGFFYIFSEDFSGKFCRNCSGEICRECAGETLWEIRETL